jgi:hypothetical protein
MRVSLSSILLYTLLLMFLSVSLYFIVYPVEVSRFFRSKGAILQESFASSSGKGIRECDCLPGFIPERNESTNMKKGYRCRNIENVNKKMACY